MNDCKNRPSDRRTKSRFAVEREMRYKLVDGPLVIASGSGKTLDLSSGGASFTTEQYLRPGATIEISVSWPALLNGNCPLRLVAYGRVLRSTRVSAACTISKFEFRTQGKPSPAEAPPSSLAHTTAVWPHAGRQLASAWE